MVRKPGRQRRLRVRLVLLTLATATGMDVTAAWSAYATAPVTCPLP